MFCTNCGKQLEPGTKFCTSCGTKVENVLNGVNPNVVEESTPTNTSDGMVVMPTNANINNNYVAPPAPVQKTKDVKSTISLIIGIVAIILSLFLNIFMIPLSIVGLILGMISKEKGGKKIASIILNVISIIIPIVILSLYIVYKDDVQSFIDKNTSSIVETTDDLKGNWKATDGSDYYVITGSKFYWYKSYYDLTDNYWYGDIKYYHGEDEFKKIGFSEESLEKLKTYESTSANLDNSYLVVFTPKQIISGGVDKTSTNLIEGTTWKYIWLINDNKAFVYNSENSDFGYYEKVD